MQCNSQHYLFALLYSIHPSCAPIHSPRPSFSLPLTVWMNESERVFTPNLLKFSPHSFSSCFPFAFYVFCFVMAFVIRFTYHFHSAPCWHSWQSFFFTIHSLLSLSLYAEALTVCSYDVCSVKILISIWINISSLIMVCECINHTHSKPSEWYINEQYQKWMKSTHNERSENRKKEWQMQRYGANEIEREKRRKKGTNETKNSQWMHRAVQSIAYGFSAHECSCVAH